MKTARITHLALEKMNFETVVVWHEIGVLADRLASHRQVVAALESELRRPKILTAVAAATSPSKFVPPPASLAMGGAGIDFTLASDPPFSRGPAAVRGLRWVPADSDRPPQVKFRLENQLERGRQIRGFTFVVLKPDPADPASWTSLPPAPLIDGRPRQCFRGDGFSIARFKRVTKNLPTDKSGQPPKRISVLVYNRNGELWAEEALHPTRSEAMAFSSPVNPDPNG